MNIQTIKKKELHLKIFEYIKLKNSDLKMIHTRE